MKIGICKCCETVLFSENMLKVYDILLMKGVSNHTQIAEQLFEQSFNTYNNLIVTCFDQKGQINWSQVVQKRQDCNINSLSRKDIELEDYRDFILETGSINQSYINHCSYALMAPLDKNEIIFFYNDHIKNIEQQGKIKNFSHPKKSYIVAVKIDEFGNLSKQIVLQWKKKALYPEPLRFYDTLHDEIVIPAFRSRKYNYYKISAKL